MDKTGEYTPSTLLPKKAVSFFMKFCNSFYAKIDGWPEWPRVHGKWVPFSKVQPRVGSSHLLTNNDPAKPSFTLLAHAKGSHVRDPKPPRPLHSYTIIIIIINNSLCTFSFTKTCNSSKRSGSGSRKRLKRCRSVVLSLPSIRISLRVCVCIF